MSRREYIAIKTAQIMLEPDVPIAKIVEAYHLAHMISELPEAVKELDLQRLDLDLLLAET
jgi:hypothetical protein